MNSSDLRKEARNKLAGKWGKAALITLSYFAIIVIINIIEQHVSDTLSSIVSLIATIIEVPLAFGLVISFFKLYHGEDVNAFDFLSSGFSNFKKAWGIFLRIAVKMILPIIVLIIAIILIIAGFGGVIGAGVLTATDYESVSSSLNGTFSGIAIVGVILYIVSMVWLIIKFYYYQLAYLLSVDNEEMSSKDAVEKSAELMSGNRWKLFCLQFSFIGWAILASMTFGIGFLWLAPYIQFAVIAFYKKLNGDTIETTVVEDKPSSEE